MEILHWIVIVAMIAFAILLFVQRKNPNRPDRIALNAIEEELTKLTGRKSKDGKQ